MKYAYYPGCSLTASAVEYDASSRAMLERLGVGLEEIPGWTCCGASAVESISRLLTYTLPARNLALIERDMEKIDQVLVPCSACYLNLLKVREQAAKDKKLAADINEVLSGEELKYTGKVRVRHILDVLINDVGPERVGEQIARTMDGIRIAPYYGCQILRPYPVFDDPERPQTMEPLLQAIGAEVFDWDFGGKCCGASLMATKQEAALELTGDILAAAQEADAIVTVCPMCQMNLEAYQSKALSAAGGGSRVTILYLPQLLGLALGFSKKEMLLGKNMEVTGRFRKKLKEREKAAA